MFDPISIGIYLLKYQNVSKDLIVKNNFNIPSLYILGVGTILNIIVGLGTYDIIR